MIRIVGNADPKMINVRQFYADPSAEQFDYDNAMSVATSAKDKRAQYGNVIKRKNRTLLTDKSTRRVADGHGSSNMGFTGSQTLDKIPEGSFKKKTEQGGADKQLADGSLKKDQMAKLSEHELAFLMDYRKLEDLEREKGIKFFKCVGDPPMTQEFQQDIEGSRSTFIQKKEVEMRERDCHRFSTQINADNVVVPAHNLIESQPLWDEHRNNHFTMKRRLLNIFLKVANRMIMRRRAG